MVQFGDFKSLCRETPSYPWCNLFYRQLLRDSPSTLVGFSIDQKSAPVGVNPDCGIPNAGFDGSLANLANILACVLSLFVTIVLIYLTSRRKGAVCRAEFRGFLVLYALSLPLQIISTGSFITQGSTALVVLTAIHAGVVAALFWALLANGIISTQFVEDGTPSAIIPYVFFVIAFFVGTLYVALDVALGFTNALAPTQPYDRLHSIPLFILTSIWPGVAALAYFGFMVYITLFMLNEVRPMWMFVLSGILFVLGQMAFFLLSKLICHGSSRKIDGSFIGTVLETAAVVTLFFAWKNITEGGPYYY